MQRYESFADCLKKYLKENQLSASEAARLVGFRSRNSIFRILSGSAGDDIKLRFLEKLREALGDTWPDAHWFDLQECLRVERLGQERYQANCAFQRLLQAEGERVQYTAHQPLDNEEEKSISMQALLSQACSSKRAEIVITGCCDSGISRLIVDACSAEPSRTQLYVRQYIDIGQNVVTQNILGVLPLVSKAWYNARLVEPESCPEEMLALYRLNCIYIQCWDEDDKPTWTTCVRYDKENFILQAWQEGLCPLLAIVDRLRFRLELLKPMPKVSDGPDSFVDYTEQYLAMEENCTILSIKPDAHFNCIPDTLLEQAVLEGFEQAGMAAGPELVELVDALKVVHQHRFGNMMKKHKPTHLVYSLRDMERFMRTGVLSDQFFIQRPYTVDERRQIIRVLLETMRNNPYFNVHILKNEVPDLHYEITCFEGRGVLLMDAYTGYELDKDHSEAMITLPVFMESFRRFFKDELLVHYVYKRADVLRILEGLLVMNIQEKR